MSAFEDFIKIELPLRQVLIKDAGDPSVNGQPAVRGTYYLDTTDNYLRYEKTGPANTDWTPIGRTQEGLIDTLSSQITALSARVESSIIKRKTYLSTDANNLSATQIACFNSTVVKAVKYNIHVENNDSYCTFELLVTYHDTTTHGQGIKHVAYAALGQDDLINIQTSNIGDVVSVSLTPTLTDLVVYCTGIVISDVTYDKSDCI